MDHDKKIESDLCLWSLVYCSQHLNLRSRVSKSVFKIGCMCGVWNYGRTKWSLVSKIKARLDKAIQLFDNQMTDTLFVSGGLGKEGHWEGTEMQKYLIANHIPVTKIRVDNKGNTTRLTAQNIAQRFTKDTKLLVVSQYFHTSRCKLSLSQAGFEQIQSASPVYFEWRDGYSIAREFFGYYWYFVKK